MPDTHVNYGPAPIGFDGPLWDENGEPSASTLEAIKDADEFFNSDFVKAYIANYREIFGNVPNT